MAVAGDEKVKEKLEINEEKFPNSTRDVLTLDDEDRLGPFETCCRSNNI
jgi:hypothetical protein